MSELIVDEVATRAAKAIEFKRNEVLTQFFPELLPRAVDIIKSEEVLVSKYPEYADDIRELVGIKLDTLSVQYVLDDRKQVVEKAQSELNKQLKHFSKGKIYNGYIDSKTRQLNVKKIRKSMMINGGKPWVEKLVSAFNNEVVPYANKLTEELGAEFTPAEQKLGNELNVKLVRHNQLAIRLKGIVKF